MRGKRGDSLKKTNVSAYLLFFITLLFWFSLYAYTSYVSPELERMGATARFVGMVGSIYGFVQLLLRIPVGIISDKWQKKFFICLGGFCSGLSALCMLIFYHPVAFFIGRGLAGIAASCWVTFTVLYSSYFRPEDSAKSITMLSMANSIGQLLSFVLAGVFVAMFGIRSVFVVSAVGGFTAFTLGLFIREADKVSGKAPVRLKDLFAVAADRHLLSSSILAAVVQTIVWATAMLFASVHAKSIGATPVQLSYMSIYLVVPAIVLNFLISKVLLQRIQAKWLVFMGFVCFVIYCFSLPHTTSVAQVYALQMFVGAGNALTISLLMGGCVRDIAPDRRSAAMGFYQAVYGIGMTVGPMVMGFLTDMWGRGVGFTVMGTLALCGACACVVLLRKKPEVETKPAQ